MNTVIPQRKGGMTLGSYTGNLNFETRPGRCDAMKFRHSVFFGLHTPNSGLHPASRDLPQDEQNSTVRSWEVSQ